MQQRPFRTRAVVLLSVATVATTGQAEILCPTSYQVEVSAAPGANTTIGPGLENQHHSEVTSQLTTDKATCSVLTPKSSRFSFTHRSVRLPGDDETSYFSHAWQEQRDVGCEPVDGEPLPNTSACPEPRQATATQVTSAASRTEGAAGGTPVDGLRVVFDCAVQAPVQVITSSGNWHATTVEAIPVDVTLTETSSPGTSPRLYDITCHYEYPTTLSVEYPRQARGEHRDVSTNLNKIGFYRAYEMNAAVWKKLCARDCGERLFVAGRGRQGLNDQLEQCVSSCVERGW